MEGGGRGRVVGRWGKGAREWQGEGRGWGE